MKQPGDLMSGKVCLISGSSSGIGKATALGLAALGAHVVMLCRDAARGKAAQAEVRAVSRNSAVDLLVADFASQQSIRQLARDIQANYQQIYVLVNNAGVLMRKRSVTSDGLEMTFAVNHLAPFLLTTLLLDLLKASAPARIINVTSFVHGIINFDDLQAEQHYSMMRAYGQSKFANILFTHELARRLQGTGVTANCLHPGIVSSNVTRDFPFPRVIHFLTRPLFLSPQQGAQTSIYLASSPEVEGVSGAFFIKKRQVNPPRQSYDEATSQQLWQVSEKLTGQVSA
jgi:NAD(P)-dependent dehydrogenase (short-subunit alcohol dehydrogenase family)